MRINLSLTAISIIIIYTSCTKESTKMQSIVVEEQPSVASSNRGSSPSASTYVTYLIRQGQHYCDKSALKSVSVTEMKFFAKFDQSAIYQTVDPYNQYDVNKLWGFSEGLNNQYNSARIGWAYNDGALRLYGYVYSIGVRYFQEITTILPGQEISCSIKLSGSTYILSANGISITLPRGSTTTKANGYQQYPYFGGDEVAPHDISIFIKPA